MKSLIFSALLASLHPQQDKILICGVCKNVENAVENTKQNIEALGRHFSDYAVIIYENNSTDNTAAKYKEWAKKNPRLIFLSETIPEKSLPASRTEQIARARNQVLALAREPKFHGFSYLIMADLDFLTPWPIQEILEVIKSPREWDCVCANGVTRAEQNYFDRYAFRTVDFPFGPELIDDHYWWGEVHRKKIRFEGSDWAPAFSAFGGLAIYKTASMLTFSYSGKVTPDLKRYYKKQIIPLLPADNGHLKQYLRRIKRGTKTKIPVIFRTNCPKEHPKNYKPVTCCEHVPLHAAMAMHGYGKIFINPKMFMYY